MGLSSENVFMPGDAKGVPLELQGRDLLFYDAFRGQDWRRGWGMEWGPSPASHGTVLAADDAPGGRLLRVHYPAGGIGGDSGYQFLCRFDRMGLAPRDEAFISYQVRFAEGFDFVKGGKLPGLCGGKANTGGHPPNGRDGFSARLMWRRDGRVVQYVYHPDQAGVWGDDLPWKVNGKDCRFVPGQWTRVDTWLKLNTPGRRDGQVKSWFNGAPALEADGLRFRDVPELRIDVLYFSTFFGGGEPDWAPSTDQSADFAQFQIRARP